MAITITLIASADDAQAATDLTLNTTATVTAAVGDWLVVLAALSNGGPGGSSSYVSTADSDGINTYIDRAEINYAPGGTVDNGVTLVIATAAVTDALTNATVTVTIGDTSASKVALVYRLHPTAGETIAFVAADTTGVTGTSTAHNAATVSVSAGRIIFGACGLETTNAVTGDSDTSNGSWSAIDAAIYTLGGAGQQVVAQYKTVTGTGNQSWSCSTTSARDSARSYLVLQGSAAAFSLSAALGQYTLSGTAATFKKGKVPAVADPGSYVLTGTAATFINTGTTKTIAADLGAYSMAGVDATLTHGYRLDATTAESYALTGTAVTLTLAHALAAAAGSYALLGSDVVLTKSSVVNKVLGTDAGAYALTGTDATITLVAAKSVVADVGAYLLTGTDAATTHIWKATVVDVGSYVLTGFAVALATAANKQIATDPGSYALAGTDVTLTAGSNNKLLVANPGAYALTGTDANLSTGIAPPVVSPLHIGEWPVDKRRRRRREDAAAAEQRARKRFRDAIGRLLEGLPPEFDEPADLDEALDSAVQASNLLYALSAPIREINAVNELIDHIRQLRIAQPIAQLHLAQAYNQAHRLLAHKAQEDAVMALLLGE